jgi:hypothetical protein
VETDRREFRVLHHLLERQREQMGHDGASVLPAEHEVRVGVAVAEEKALLRLPGPVRAEHGHRVGVEVDRPASLLRLWLRERQDVSGGDERLLHHEPTALEIEVAPAQPEHLAAAHSRRRCEVQRGLEPVALRSFEKSTHVTGLPELPSLAC